ncbi:MAG: helicase-associated domain-containing protein [Chloroflexi bacterium]|nr:helicase-associated domain-containing protein [Chloroflexota bacterium]
MRTLLVTLLDHDSGLLEIIARRWDADLESLDKRAAAETLAAAMLDPERAAREWSRLNDSERGALQTVLGTPEHKMTEVQFSRLFGVIRQMGPGRRDREKPHLNPASITETLYYRGLIALVFDQSKTGMQPFVYVPPDLAAVLPTHETGFDLSTEPEEITPAWDEQEEITPEAVKQATTAIVDDLTSLLAYLQVFRVPAETTALYQTIQKGMAGYWLGEHQAAAVALLTGVAGSMGIAATEGDIYKPIPAQARRWLEDTRPKQVRILAEAWRNSTLFNDLWHTPGLKLEETGWRNDPLLARQTVLTFLEMVPPAAWWPLDELIEQVYDEEPDFQRPAGDYDSWYIRDAATNEYLRGFEHWDRVDGAVLRFILTGPMHWLGLVDLGDSGTLCRLTVYGRALCGKAEWPAPAEDRATLTIDADGTIRAPRTLSRYERFQLARITDWVSAGDPYVYRLTATSLQRAAGQDIQADAMLAFLRRTGGGSLPESVQRMLSQWERTSSADLWLSRAVILRANSPDALQAIIETPELRRYLGATLGPTAVIVRAGQENDLMAALQQRGILVEFND